MIFVEVCISVSVWVCDTWFPNQSHIHAGVRAASINSVCIYVYMCKRKTERKREKRVTEHLKSPVLLAVWLKKEAQRWRLWPSWSSAPWLSSVWLQVRATQQNAICFKSSFKTAAYSINFTKFKNLPNWFIWLKTFVVKGITWRCDTYLTTKNLIKWNKSLLFIFFPSCLTDASTGSQPAGDNPAQEGKIMIQQ